MPATNSRRVIRRIVTGDLPTVSAEKVTVLQDLQLITVTPAIQVERGFAPARVPPELALKALAEQQLPGPPRQAAEKLLERGPARF